MIASDTAPALLFQPIPAQHGTRVAALRAAADPARMPPTLEQLLEDACCTVASWNRRHPSHAVDLVVDLSGCPLESFRVEQAIRFALARSGLGGERLRVGVVGFADDPERAPVPAARLASVLLPRTLARQP